MAGLVITLDLATADGGRWRTLMLHRPGRVAAVTLASDGLLTATSYDDRGWQAALARQAELHPAMTGATTAATTGPSPAQLVELPHDLLLGTGAALADGRATSYDALLARAAGLVRADGEPLTADRTRELLARLHGSVAARLLLRGSRGHGCHGRAVGWVSWLAYDDGWRALTPYADRGRPMVRVEPRRPADLGAVVARWALRTDDRRAA